MLADPSSVCADESEDSTLAADDDSEISSASAEVTAGARAYVAVATEAEVNDDGRALQTVLDRVTEKSEGRAETTAEDISPATGAAEESALTELDTSLVSVSASMSELDRSSANSAASPVEEDADEVRAVGSGIMVAVEVETVAPKPMLRLGEATAASVCWTVLAAPTLEPLEAIGVAIKPSKREGI